MRTRILFYLFGLSLLSFGLSVSAATIFDIQFPIPELNNCADKDACRAYCDDLAHKDACVAFAQAHGLVDKNTAVQAQKLPQVGPGGCSGETACKAYCDDIAHSEECLSFAEQHNLLSKKDIDGAKKFLGQTGPGGCKGAQECRTYCADSAHQTECLDFANRKGLISDKHAEVIKKILTGGGPGGCKSEEECKTYCSDPAHIDECVQFGQKHGLISQDEAQRVKKMALNGGPGGCQGQEQCKTYCSDPAHQEECIAFSEKNGFVSHQEANKARKFIGKSGPGGCQGEQCKEFCSDQANAQTCLEYAQKEGLLQGKDAEQAKKYLDIAQNGGPGGCKGQECKAYCADQAHHDECIQFAKEHGLINAAEVKQFEAGSKIQQVIQTQGGPGGCKSQDECKTYCSDSTHVEECVAFSAGQGGMSEADVRAKLKVFSESQSVQRGKFISDDELQQAEQGSTQKFEEFRALEKQFRGADTGLEQNPSSGEESQGGAGNTENSPVQQKQFIGPGGCASPSECIKYCSNHKDECFGSSGRIQQQTEQGQSGENSDTKQFHPQLRHNLITPFRGDIAPTQDQGQFPQEQKAQPTSQGTSEEFFGKFKAIKQEPNQIPGRPQQFPGKPGEFPGRIQQFPGGAAEQKTFDAKQQILNGIKPFSGTTGITNPFTRPPSDMTSGSPIQQNSFESKMPSSFPSAPFVPSSGIQQPPAFSPPPSSSGGGSGGSFQVSPPSGGTVQPATQPQSMAPIPTGTFAALLHSFVK